jgi:hypothetical protein
MFERRVSMKSILRAIQAGDIIEDYSSEMPEPGRLILGVQGRRPFHVVTAQNVDMNTTIVVTVYNPDPHKWSRNFRRRR